MIQLASKLATSSANENEWWTLNSLTVNGERMKEAKTYFVYNKHNFVEKLLNYVVYLIVYVDTNSNLG